jgi:hypothetical protein
MATGDTLSAAAEHVEKFNRDPDASESPGHPMRRRTK